LIEPLRCRSGSFASGGTSRTSPHRRALRLGPPPVKEKCSSRCSTNVFSRVDLARALRVRLSFARRHRSHDARRSDPASLPPRRDLLGPNLVRGPLSTWQWIAFPRDPTGALFPRRHSCERSRRARSPPPKVFLLRRRPARWLGLPGARGCGPMATPVLSTDVCSSRILFSKTIAPSLGARRIAMFPRDTRACGFTPQRSLR